MGTIDVKLKALMKNTLKTFGRGLLLVFIVLQCNLIFGQYATKVLLEKATAVANKTLFENESSKLLTAITSSFFDDSKIKYKDISISDAAKKNLNSLWTSSPFRCKETEIIKNIVKRADGNFEIRDIPLILKNAPDSDNYQEAVIVISPAGEIDNFYFGVEAYRYTQLLKQSLNVTDFRRRQIILDFVENFRTAYTRKDLGFISSVFSEGALIIVGKVVEPVKNSNDFLDKTLGEEKKVELKKYTKAQYMSNLGSCFKVNKFIKLSFENIEIVQHTLYPELYGVTLKQYWNSSSYKDIGYLFLLIDFKDENKPMIHVRTWQPDQYTKKDEVLQLNDFDIIR